jgi:hypothetical protein
MLVFTSSTLPKRSFVAPAASIMRLLTRINDWCRRELTPTERGLRLTSVALTHAQLRERLCGEKRDFAVTTTEDHVVTAVCHSCSIALETVWRDPLLWFRCPDCSRVSFNPAPNILRDAVLAQQDGRPFRYDLFYMKDLPSGLGSPFQGEPGRDEQHRTGC